MNTNTLYALTRAHTQVFTHTSILTHTHQGVLYRAKSYPLAEKELSFSEWRTVYLSSSEKRSWLAIL